jgi:cell division septation protein DedD
MRGVFDEREAERERRKRGRDDGREEKRDREVTLGSFTLLSILFALVVLCGLSFGLGYVVGRREPAAKSTVLEATPIAAQGEGAKTKPSGGTGAGSGRTASNESPAAQGGDAADSQAGAADSEKEMQPATQSVASAAKVQPALPAATDMSKPRQSEPSQAQPAAAKSVQPALQLATKKALEAAPDALMVRVATLAHQEDADVLVEALRRRGYAVGAHRDVVDGMVHVRVGPFASRDVANQWRQKLLNDGYNAVVESQ